jgi:6-phosphogluconolactonase (cycloisomerase 2 family)
MAQPAPLSSPSSRVWRPSRVWQLVVLQATLGVTVAAQTPQQQYVYGSTPTTTVASQVVAYAKNQNGDLSAIAGPPFADSSPGGAMAIDGLGRFLFVINTATNTISMLQINQNTGSLTEVPGP